MSEQEKTGDASPPRASRHLDAPVRRHRCTPGSRVRTLVDSVVKHMRADRTPMTISNFKKRAEFIGNCFPGITKESRKEMKRQALRMWLNDQVPPNPSLTGSGTESVSKRLLEREQLERKT